MLPLPIDPLLPQIVELVAKSSSLVLEAPPGAGKTTRVPWVLSEMFGSGEVIVTEPRRLAARMAAERVAKERGDQVGRRVGYSVRFEDVSGPETRLKYVTEGVLLRRLIQEPRLLGVRAVVLDEFHERHLTTDLLLSLLSRVAAEREDFRLLVMSATLEAEPVAHFLGDCPRLRSEGRLYPLTIEHLASPDDRPLEKQVVSAVRRAVSEQAEGDVLVFLPGAAEIRRAQEALEVLAREQALDVVPLHGDLSLQDQTRAVELGPRRKVVLATNVAESSITIEGVSAVVDCGLARVAGHSPWSGMPTLSTEKISRASATQRAGRAGRTRPGRVYRLYTSGDLQHRPEHDVPEVLRADLTEAELTLLGAGLSASSVAWLTPPPRASLEGARTLLEWLGVTTAEGGLNELGRRMLDLPVSPRQARIVLEGEKRGVAQEACVVAALLGERDIRREARTDFGRGPRGESDARGPSDLLELFDLFEEATQGRDSPDRLRALGLDPRTFQTVRRTSQQLSRLTRNRSQAPGSLEERDTRLLACILSGFADRLAQRRRSGQPELTLSNGATARLSPRSVVKDAMLLVAVDVDDRPGRGAEVRLASAVDENLLLELYPERVHASDEVEWNDASERVEKVERLRFGSIVLDETRVLATTSPAAAGVLLGVARARSHEFSRGEALGQLTARIELAAKTFPEKGLPENAAELVSQALQAACENCVSLAELRAIDLAEYAQVALSPDNRRLLEQAFPARVPLGGGRQVAIHYEPGKLPWIESRLQDFFGMRETPRIAQGRIALTLHLLAPNQRAVQVTGDLDGFWERHYPSIRKELMRRYPRHAWPEDGRTATPPAPRR